MSRYIGKYTEYASGLMRCLTEHNVPKEMIQRLQEEHDNILQSRLYTAPEAIDESLEKYRFFQKFVELEKGFPIPQNIKQTLDEYLKNNG